MSDEPDIDPHDEMMRQRAQAFVEGLRRLADFVDANPDLRSHIGALGRQKFYVYVNKDPAAGLAAFAKAGLRAGTTVTKTYDGKDQDQWANVVLDFTGGIQIEAYAPRGDVCERVVVGTEDVVEEVPDPEALAAVPKVKVTKTVDKVEWICKPILAADDLAGESG